MDIIFIFLFILGIIVFLFFISKNSNDNNIIKKIIVNILIFILFIVVYYFVVSFIFMIPLTMMSSNSNGSDNGLWAYSIILGLVLSSILSLITTIKLNRKNGYYLSVKEKTKKNKIYDKVR